MIRSHVHLSNIMVNSCNFSTFIYFRMFFANEIKNLKLLLEEVDLEQIFDEDELAAFKHARPNIVDNLHVPVGHRRMQTARLKKVVGPDFDLHEYAKQVLGYLRRGTEIRIGKQLVCM